MYTRALPNYGLSELRDRKLLSTLIKAAVLIPKRLREQLLYMIFKQGISVLEKILFFFAL